MCATLRGVQDYWRLVLGLVFITVFCFSPYDTIAAASDPLNDESATGGSLQVDGAYNGHHVKLPDDLNAMEDDRLTGLIDSDIDGEDDLSMKDMQTTSSKTALSGSPARNIDVAESLALGPQSPPPDMAALTVSDSLLLATNTTKATTASETGRTSPAPEPKTSKSGSVSTPLLVGAGVAIVAGAVAAAGGSSSSDDSSPGTPAPPGGNPGDTSSGSADVIHLSSLVRIGDDTDYNGNHPDKFKQNRPSGTSWTDSFNISNANNVRLAEFKYTVAGSKVANPVYINGHLAGKLCNPGNTAWNVESCSIVITGLIHSGSNEINIKCAIDEHDTSTPYDDVELYNLRIELTR